jgi:LacI family gluconate utilization system Gnt-I transcriptional repressor
MAEMRKRRTGGGQQAVRIQDVARHAGVSPMTVSRALREPDKVSEKMRRRVQEAVLRIGYLPNRIAGTLSSNRSNVVGLIVPSIRNSLFAHTVQGISDTLHAAHHHLMIADSGYSLDDEEAAISAFLQQRVCALILHNTRHTERARQMIARAGLPVVEIGNLVSDPLDMTVSYSNFEASKAMTLHLARLGYRHIGFVSLPLKDNERSIERRRGYVAGLAESGRALDPRIALEMPGGIAAGAEAIVRLVQSEAPPDAVFFAGDVLAVGAMLECQRRNWAVPGRIAVASFDDVDLLRELRPAVTSVRIPRYEIGRRSAEVLLDRVAGRAQERVAVDLRFEIIQREST